MFESDSIADTAPADATLTMALTGKNEIVGTLYYMSPEQLQAQANGQEDDARSDIFSFGLLLYEMLTGNGHELLFRTNDNRIMVATYAAKADSFVRDEPRPWSDKPLANLGLTTNYDLAPDGKRIAALMPPEAPEGQQPQNHVVFLLNFSDELQRKVPAGK